jgi:Tol biopolymer transport system component
VFFPSVAISSDGTQIAYMANQRVYVRTLSDLTVRPVVGSESPGTNMGQIVFSPDGQSIAYWVRTGPPRVNAGRQIGGEIRRVPTGGGTPFTVVKIEFVPDGIQWLDDTLIFAQGNRIVRVSSNGSAPEQLVQVADNEEIQSPRMLPGGAALLFTTTPRSVEALRGDLDQAEVVVQSLHSTERRVITQGSDALYLSTGHLIFLRAGVVFAVAFNPTSLQMTGSPVQVLDGVRRTETQQTRGAFNFRSHFAISDSGTLVYVPGTGGGPAAQRNLVVLDKAGVAKPLKLPIGAYEDPRVSPDGKSLAVATTGGDAHVSIVELSGTAAPRRLTLMGNNRFPLWSADGRHIAFQSDREGDQAIFWQQANGATDAERLTRPDKDVAHVPAAWFPDEDRFLFVERRKDASTLWAYSLRDRTATRFGSFESTGGGSITAHVSPDRKWIAYSYATTGPGELYLQSSTGTGSQYLIASPGRFPRWTADGVELLYTARSAINVIRPTSQPGQFTTPTTLSAEVSGILTTAGDNYDVLPDGGFVTTAGVNSLGPDGRQINVVVNWIEDVKHLTVRK